MFAIRGAFWTPMPFRIEALDDPRRTLAAAVEYQALGSAPARAEVHPVARATLAARIALLPAGLLETGQCAQIDAYLLRLSEDPDPLIRAALTQALQHSPAAPAAVIRRLAQDRAAAVSGPVLRNSPLLREADLVALVAGNGGPAALAAIAARGGVGPALADAIVATHEPEAVLALLTNATAAIDAATLLAVIEGARRQPAWQAALVRRPALSQEAALALGEHLAGDHLATLAGRLDLPHETTAALLDLMIHRFAVAPPQGEDDAAALARARVLHSARLLDDGLVQQAALREEERFVIAALKLRSGMDHLVIDRIRERRDPDAVAALVARAGFGVGCTQAVVAMMVPSARRQDGPGQRRRQRYVAAPGL